MKKLIRKFFEKYSREHELFERIAYLEQLIERDQNDWFAERAAKQHRIAELEARHKAMTDPYINAQILSRLKSLRVIPNIDNNGLENDDHNFTPTKER